MSNWKKELAEAVLNDDIDDFDVILSRFDVKSEIKEINEWQWGEDPLHQAAMKGHDEMLTKLLEAGAKVNAYSYFHNFKSTALHWAASL